MRYNVGDQVFVDVYRYFQDKGNSEALECLANETKLPKRPRDLVQGSIAHADFVPNLDREPLYLILYPDTSRMSPNLTWALMEKIPETYIHPFNFKAHEPPTPKTCADADADTEVCVEGWQQRRDNLEARLADLTYRIGKLETAEKSRGIIDRFNQKRYTNDYEASKPDLTAKPWLSPQETSKLPPQTERAPVRVIEALPDKSTKAKPTARPQLPHPPGTLYRHYKNRRYYIIIALSLNEDDDWEVIYQRHGSLAEVYNQPWDRFWAHVGDVPRFEDVNSHR